MMMPLWIAYPCISRYSIGWRMGEGESYANQFYDWLNTLSREEQRKYQELFPEPVTWNGYWNDEDNCEAFSYGEQFCIPLWQKSGMPKYTRESIQQEMKNGKKYNFCFFWGGHPSKDGGITKSCLSQWWLEDFWSEQQKYCCMEQFMMEKKAELFGDKEIQKKILENENPKQIKALGRKVRNFDQELWNKVKYSIVLNGNWMKFRQNRKLREFLLSTGDSVLVEASPYDTIWGIGLSEKAEDVQNPLKWNGQNLLGFALMEVRDEIKRVYKNESHCNEN